MGAFFTNVQVHTGNQSPDAVRARLIAALRRRLLLRGQFVEITDDAEADREVLIAPAGSGPWIAVYDEVTEDQDERVLLALTKALSRAAGGAAVGVLVCDSDVLELRLCRAGAQVDIYNSRPDYDGQVLSARRRRQMTGDPECWRDLLVGWATLDDLRRILDERPVFAEDTLYLLSVLLAWDVNRCALGWRDLSRGELEIAGLTRLRFRSTHATLHGYGEGLARLKLVGGRQGLTAAVGQRFGAFPLEVAASAHSAGGPARGLEIHVWGSALDQELVEVTTMQVVQRDKSGQIAKRYDALLHQTTASGGQLYVARLLNFDIPAGAYGPVFGELAQGTSLHRRLDVRRATLIGTTLYGVARAAGRGELRVGLVPMMNPEEGQVTWTIPIRIVTPDCNEEH